MVFTVCAAYTHTNQHMNLSVLSRRPGRLLELLGVPLVELGGERVLPLLHREVALHGREHGR